MGIEVLERWRAPRLLLLLYKEGPLLITQIRWKLKGSQSSLYDTLKLLTEAGLIEEIFEEDSWPKRRLFKLTPLGRKVAEKLAEIETILAEKGGEGGGGSR